MLNYEISESKGEDFPGEICVLARIRLDSNEDNDYAQFEPERREANKNRNSNKKTKVNPRALRMDGNLNLQTPISA